MRKIISTVLLAVFSILMASVIALILISPGKPSAIRDRNGKSVPGSISEIVTWQINGIPQTLIIRGWDRKAPVLLFLHGGPGSPEYPFYKATCTDLEKAFLVVHWEQRGSGKSYSRDIPKESMTIEQFIRDTLAITEKLKTGFRQEKIYLLGHSWGAALGILAAQRRPDLYHAYISVAQPVHFIHSEKLAYQWVTGEAKKHNDAKAIRSLDEIGPPPFSLEQKGKEMKWVIQYGGGFTHDTDRLMPLMIGSLLKTGEYTVRDKINYFKGIGFTLGSMWDEISAANIEDKVRSLDIPVYMIQGEYDYQVSTPMARAFLHRLKAPRKKYYLFKDCAHGAIFEKPEDFITIMTNEVKKGR